MKPGRYIILYKNDMEKTPYWVHSDFNMLDILEITNETEYVKYSYVGDKIIRERGYFEFMEIKLAPYSSLMEELI
jgi:hypothetical protein